MFGTHLCLWSEAAQIDDITKSLRKNGEVGGVVWEGSGDSG